MERPKKLKCATKYCRNEAAPQRTICEKCKSRQLKERNPELYHYNIFRCNARRRGKEFSITFEEYKKFCRETNYLILKGKNAENASIDRIDDTRGYSYDNIRILTLAQNSYRNATGKDPEDCPY